MAVSDPTSTQEANPVVTEQMEEYLETIYRLEGRGERAKTGRIATELELGAPAVTDMIQRLEQAHFVTYERYKGVELTDSGRAIGRAQLEKHRVMQAFLQEIVGMEHREAHEAACDMEHSIPAQLKVWMENYLNERLDTPFDPRKRVGDQIS